MQQRYKIMKRIGPYGAWYDVIPAVALYNWWTSDNELPTTPPPQGSGSTPGYTPTGTGLPYDPTQIELPKLITDPEEEKWPSWVWPVGLTVGGLAIAGISVYVAKKLDKKKTSSAPKFTVRTNPRRKRK
jgi:hypothetical protein